MTPLPGRAMDQDAVRRALIEAVHGRRIVRLVYDGAPRFVEPHAFGEGRVGPALWAYQIDGGADKLPRWRLYRADRVEGLDVVDVLFDVRRDHRPPPTALVAVYASVDDVDD